MCVTSASTAMNIRKKTYVHRLMEICPFSKATVYGLPDYPTALERCVFEVQQKLANTPVLGIVGMGGIRKTTIAKELLNKIYPQFEYTCFVDNVKGMTVREPCKNWSRPCAHNHKDCQIISASSWL